jgi:hypothetical protein
MPAVRLWTRRVGRCKLAWKAGNWPFGYIKFCRSTERLICLHPFSCSRPECGVSDSVDLFARLSWDKKLPCLLDCTSVDWYFANNESSEIYRLAESAVDDEHGGFSRHRDRWRELVRSAISGFHVIVDSSRRCGLRSGPNDRHSEVHALELWRTGAFHVVDSMNSQECFNSRYFMDHIMELPTRRIFPSGRWPHAHRVHVHLDNCRVHFSKVSECLFAEKNPLYRPHPLYRPAIANRTFTYSAVWRSRSSAVVSPSQMNFWGDPRLRRHYIGGRIEIRLWQLDRTGERGHCTQLRVLSDGQKGNGLPILHRIVELSLRSFCHLW